MRSLIFFSFFYLVYVNESNSQCPTPTAPHTSSITYYNAQANWNPVVGVDHYRIRYREIGTPSWSNLGNIGQTDSTRNIPLLQQLTTYEWQIKAFCDSTNQIGSNWSSVDTFTTINFVAAPFNPLVVNSISHQICDSSTNLTLRVSQNADEPDIGTTVITSSGGSFDMYKFNFGDSIGFAILNTSSNTIVSTLRMGIALNNNYATVNSFDSVNNLIGFFTIENLQTGIRVSTTSPNDGNNYTSGYISEVRFTDIFKNPSTSGFLSFYSKMESELNDNVLDTNKTMITCNTSLPSLADKAEKKLTSFYSILGQLNIKKEKGILIELYNDGSFEKKIIFK